MVITLKEKFIKSTIILIIGGFLTKILGMFIRIITTRTIGIEGMSLYMLIFPTFSLFMALSQISLPTAISKLVSEERYNNKNIVFTSIPFLLVVNLFLIILLIFISKPIAIHLLHDERCYIPILAIALVLPFDSLSNMLRGYFFGKQKMFPHVISHIFEQLVRLTLTVLIIPNLIKINVIYAVTFLILVNIISEVLSIFILLMFLPRDFILKKEDIIPNKNNLKDILSISIPTTGARLTGNISLFLEPIILTFSLINNGFNQTYFQNEYAVISGYVLPILLLPGFFTNAISNALLPNISKMYSDRNKKGIKKKLILAIFISLIIGIPLTILFIIKPDFLLKLIYHTTLGDNYLKILAPFFLLYYIENPLSSCLQAMNKSKNIMYDNLYGTIIKSLSLLILPYFNLGIYSLIIGYILNVSIITLRHYLAIKKELSN